MREPSSPIREMSERAVDASRKVALARFWLKAISFSVIVGVFLAFVGAFGSEPMPIVPRYLLFVGISVVLMATAFGVVMLVRRVPAIQSRPWLRQVTIVAILTPMTAVIVWTIVGFIFMGGPKLAHFPTYLTISFVMTITMSTLSQLVFSRDRERDTKRASSEAGIEDAAAEDLPPVRFLERLPINLKGADLWAVQAEDHYVRVHTSKGSALILLRLADAAAELEGLEGARVHRSWWVARTAVEGADRRGAQTVLKLSGGVEAPVSRAQVAELKRAGWW